MKLIISLLCLLVLFSCDVSPDNTKGRPNPNANDNENVPLRKVATSFNTSLDSLYVDAKKKLYGDNVKVEVCNKCPNHGSLPITLTRVNDVFQINLADYSTAAAILANAKERGLTKALNNNGDTVSLFTRCICFQVTDNTGTRTECFLCEEPPVVRCIGPFPYCPSGKAIFAIDEDDSKNYISIQNIHLPNETCKEGWMTMNNSNLNRKIRVYYSFNNRPMVCEVQPNNYVLLGCKGGDYVITSSVYI